MIALFTRFVGPTNHRGARVMARTADGRRVTVSWDHGIDPAENHARAAAHLVRTIGLAPCTLARFGDTEDQKGYVYAVTARVVDGVTIGPAYVHEVE